MSPAAARVFADVLEKHTGQQLVPGRRWRIETALGPLMREREIQTLDILAFALARTADRDLGEAVVEALLNNETFFFREAAAFDALMDAVAGRIAAARGGERRLRIWCAGCSTGQEVYSLAMRFAEAEERWRGWTIELLGSDISRVAVAQAREGSYSQFEVQRGLPIRTLLNWFEADGERWRANQALRKAAQFRVHNLLDAAPVARADVILCRNVLLYFAPSTRGAVFARLADAIAPDGILMLGAGETVLGQTDRFVTDPNLRGLYRPA